ncbi:hypothetical protein [Streptomyces cyaneofuscatus]|uniref:hypothetical protein n=1 Tax=Streptomyces cyaneofuscatus TaxID=66883 RepID=UPI0037921F87
MNRRRLCLSPGRAQAGGTASPEGTLEGPRASETVAGRHLDDLAALKDKVRKFTGALEIGSATSRNSATSISSGN